MKTLKGKRMRILLQSLAFVVLASGFTTGQLIVDHHCTRLTKVPKSAITLAKSKLHIVYGHTSHGSQLTTGMTGLVTFTKGCGGPEFAWNDGGTGGALDFHDGGMAGDVGSYPQWVDETKKYLNNPSNSNVNVVIWSWCGQHSWYSEKQMNEWYLAPMTQLEKDYPKVTFVYMTGHVFNGYNREPMMARNKQIREYCVANKKVLYDFADIESYDPDGKFFTYVDDNCDYYDKEIGGTKLGNWAIEWQNAHTQDVDWYNCSSAHSQPLNANQKAYGAWWLWARLAGWSGEAEIGTSYCTAGANGAKIYATGSESVLENDLVLTALGVPPNESGLFYYGDNQMQVPFGQGFRCVGGSHGVFRLNPVVNSGPFGVLNTRVDLTLPPSPYGVIHPGTTWNFQAWFRDGAAFDLSDAVEVTFLP